MLHHVRISFDAVNVCPADMFHGVITHFLHVMCVPSGDYFVLAGQHTVAALQHLRKEHLKHHMTSPAWLTTVSCDILRFTVPVERRRTLAGNYQHRQHQQAPITLHRILYWMQAHRHSTVLPPLERCRKALGYAGYSRDIDAV